MKKAFTLIELLVVIAIVAILVSLIATALSQARTKARSLRCMNNLRSQGQALTMYVDTYKEYYVDTSHAIMPADYLIPFCDAPMPSTEVRIEPWTCPIDKELWTYTGYSYRYWPSTYYAWSRLSTPNQYTKYKNLTTLFLYEPNAVYFEDLLAWHSDKWNAVYADNSVRARN